MYKIGEVTGKSIMGTFLTNTGQLLNFLCHPVQIVFVIICWPESENRFVANNAVHYVAGKRLLVAVIALHFRCKSQLLRHLKPDFSQSIDCAEYGTWLQRH